MTPSLTQPSLNSGQPGRSDCLLHHHLLPLLLQVITITITITIIVAITIIITFTITIFTTTYSLFVNRSKPFPKVITIILVQIFSSDLLHPHCYKGFLTRALQIVGPFVIMIYRMIAKDLLRFFVIYLIFIMGYSQAYYIIFQTYNGIFFHQEFLAKTKFPMYWFSQMISARGCQVAAAIVFSLCPTTRPLRASSGYVVGQKRITPWPSHSLV